MSNINNLENYQFFVIGPCNKSIEEIALQVLCECRKELLVDAQMGCPGQLSGYELGQLYHDRDLAKKRLINTTINIDGESISPEKFVTLHVDMRLFVDWNTYRIGMDSFTIVSK